MHREGQFTLDIGISRVQEMHLLHGHTIDSEICSDRGHLEVGEMAGISIIENLKTASLWNT